MSIFEKIFSDRKSQESEKQKEWEADFIKRRDFRSDITKRQLAKVLLGNVGTMDYYKNMSTDEILQGLRQAQRMLRNALPEDHLPHKQLGESIRGSYVSSWHTNLSASVVEAISQERYQYAMHELVDCIANYEEWVTYSDENANECDDEKGTLSDSEIQFLFLLITSALALMEVKVGTTA